MNRITLTIASLLVLGACTSSSGTPVPPGLHNDPLPKNAQKLDLSVRALATAPACIGDGQSGKRVQAVYFVASDRQDRYAETVGQIRTGFAPNVDYWVNKSAARYGRTGRVRWACVNGQVDVVKFVGTPTSDDNWVATRDALRAAGYKRTDRKYLIWADAAVYCGMAGTTTNPEAGTGYARIDRVCWGSAYPVELHELAHNLGAVSKYAKHSNGRWHCNDEYDRLCYKEGSNVMTYTCAWATSAEGMLDCNGDDYFNAGSPTIGVPEPTPINLARSSYLLIEPPPPPLPSPSPTPTTASPSPTCTPTTASPCPTP